MSEERELELLPDNTPILTLPPDDPEEELNEEQMILKEKRIKAQRCKVIALNDMGLHPITTNVSNLKQFQKTQILKRVEDLFETDNEEIIKEFNKVCNEVVFNGDYENYPIYKRPLVFPTI